MKRKNHKYTLLLVCLLLTVLLAVGGTIAYIFTDTDPVVNTFTPVKVDNEIHEELEANVKENVQIKNTGTTDAFIRAKVVVTWQNEKGEVYPVMPVSKLENSEEYDYEILYNQADWAEIASTPGYWYFRFSVAPGEFTTSLIESAEPTKAAPAEGYTLHIEILSQAIQSEPATAVQDAWNVSIADYVEVVSSTTQGGE